MQAFLRLKTSIFTQKSYKSMGRAFYILVIFILSCSGLMGQTLMSGGWRTSTANPYTRITAGSIPGTRVYRLDCTTLADNSILQFKIIADGTEIPATMQEGSYVVVEGNNIAIQQLNPGTMVKGTWTILQQFETPASVIPWTYYPSLNNDLLIASFKVEQEFLLSINSTSPNCTNTSFTVFIDGQAVKDASNKPLKFLEGSTLYGKGKYVTIRASGTCTPDSPIYGDLKINK